MTELVKALRALGLQGELAASGRWVKLRGEHCSVYVAEAAWGAQYCTWCDDPQARTVELYSTAREAIQAGQRRASRLGKEQGN